MTRSASVPSRAAGLGGVPEIWDSSEPRRAHGPDAESGLPRRGASRISGGHAQTAHGQSCWCVEVCGKTFRAQGRDPGSAMNPTTPLVKEFFARWERIINAFDLDAIGSQYADPFMFADPSGVRVVPKERFLAALPRRREFFDTLGHKSTEILSVHETVLDDRYVMARVAFRMVFERSPTQRMDARVESTFIMQVADASPTIVLHIDHEDLQRVMRERGLLPARA